MSDTTEISSKEDGMAMGMGWTHPRYSNKPRGPGCA